MLYTSVYVSLSKGWPELVPTLIFNCIYVHEGIQHGPDSDNHSPFIPFFDLPPPSLVSTKGERKIVDTEAGAVIVANVEGSFYAVLAKCPHLGLPMKTGR